MKETNELIIDFLNENKAEIFRQWKRQIETMAGKVYRDKIDAKMKTNEWRDAVNIVSLLSKEARKLNTLFRDLVRKKRDNKNHSSFNLANVFSKLKKQKKTDNKMNTLLQEIENFNDKHDEATKNYPEWIKREHHSYTVYYGDTYISIHNISLIVDYYYDDILAKYPSVNDMWLNMKFNLLKCTSIKDIITMLTTKYDIKISEQRNMAFLKIAYSAQGKIENQIVYTKPTPQ